MTETPVPESLSALTDRLTKTTNEWREESQELRKVLNEQGRYGRKNRKWIYWLGFSIFIDVVLSISVAALAVGVASNHTQSETNRNTQIATCNATNQSRMDNKQLWTFFIQILVPDPNKASPDVKAALVKLHQKIDATYALRDCTKLGPSGTPTLTLSPSPS